MTLSNAPERIFATINGMSTRLPDGHRQLIGGWSQDADRRGAVEYVRADLQSREPFDAMTIELTGCEYISRDIANVETIAATGSNGKQETAVYVKDIPIEGEIWEHTKTANRYSIEGAAFNTITDKIDVIYRPLYPCAYERFSRPLMGVEKAWTTPNEDGTPRFKLVLKACK